jgi:NAD-dependent histone deacetylase SIR2
VFDISYFRTDPQPFYTLAKSLNPEKYTPTITHAFISLVARKGLLHKCFTQNIDTLERRAGVPASKLIEAHGSFSSQNCIDCFKGFPHDFMEPHYSNGTVPHCDGCGGLVKPNITFFGEALPSEFHESAGMVAEADLVIIMGSSLRVFPFSMLPETCSEKTVRLLINKEPTGGIGSRLDDVIVLGGCDQGVRDLAEELGWLEELEHLWTSIGGCGRREMAAEENLTIDDQIGRLTKEVEQGLNVADQFKTHVEAELQAQDQKDNKEIDEIVVAVGNVE